MRSHEDFETEMKQQVAKLKALEAKKKQAEADHKKFLIDLESLLALDVDDAELIEEFEKMGLNPELLKDTALKLEKQLTPLKHQGISDAGIELSQELERIGFDSDFIEANKKMIADVESKTFYELIFGVTGPKTKN